MVTEGAGYSIEAEQAVVGTALQWPEKIPHILSVVSSADFSTGYRPWIEAAEALSAEWKQIDAVVLIHRMAGNDSEQNQHLRQTALELTDLVPTAQNLDLHLSIVKDMSRFRAIRAAALKITAAPPTLDGLPEIVETMVSALRDDRKHDSKDMAQMWELFMESHADEVQPKRPKTGLSKLDAHLRIDHGLYGILAGYPSDGKTALALKFALNFAKQGYRVGFFSFETDHDRLIRRIAAMVSGIQLDAIADNNLTPGDWNEISAAMKQTEKLPIDFIRASGMTVHGVRDRSRARKYDIVVIDYIQLIRPAGRNQKRFDAVTDISIGIHEFTQQTGITVLALSQFSRPERYAGAFPPPPTMSMLRESGQLEQDADFILAVYQSDFEESEKKAGCRMPDGTEMRTLQVLKDKDGKRHGRLRLVFDGALQRFTQLENIRPKRYEQQRMVELPDDGNNPFDIRR